MTAKNYFLRLLDINNSNFSRIRAAAASRKIQSPSRGDRERMRAIASLRRLGRIHVAVRRAFILSNGERGVARIAWAMVRGERTI